MHFVHAPLEDGSLSKPGPTHTRVHRNTLLGASQLTQADKVGHLPQHSAEFRSLATIDKLQIVNR